MNKISENKVKELIKELKGMSSLKDGKRKISYWYNQKNNVVNSDNISTDLIKEFLDVYNQLKKKLSCEHIVLEDNECSVPTVCSKTNLTYVCRLRQVSDDEIMFFVIADNLRRGAAFNAVLILKKLIENKFILEHNKNRFK